VLVKVERKVKEDLEDSLDLLEVLLDGLLPLLESFDVSS